MHWLMYYLIHSSRSDIMHLLIFHNKNMTPTRYSLTLKSSKLMEGNVQTFKWNEKLYLRKYNYCFRLRICENTVSDTIICPCKWKELSSLTMKMYSRKPFQFQIAQLISDLRFLFLLWAIFQSFIIWQMARGWGTGPESLECREKSYSSDSAVSKVISRLW